jgi:hypothetical protein
LAWINTLNNPLNTENQENRNAAMCIKNKAPSQYHNDAQNPHIIKSGNETNKMPALKQITNMYKRFVRSP